MKIRSRKMALVVCLIICISISLITPVYAADNAEAASGIIITEPKSINGEKVTLTYEEAVQHALAVNPDITQANIEYHRAEKNYTNFKNLYRNNESTAVDQKRMDLANLYQWTKKSLELTKDQVTYKVHTSMDDISIKIAEIDNQKKKVNLAKENLRIGNIKHHYGIISTLSLKDLQNDYDAELITLNNLETDLDSLYISFNKLMDYPSEQRDVFEFSLDFCPYSENQSITISDIISRTKSTDPYLWYLQKTTDSAEYKLITYDYIANGQSYTMTKLDFAEAKNQKEEKFKKFDEVVEKRFNEARQLENTIESLSIKKNAVSDALDVIKLQNKLGMASQIEVDTLESSLNDIEYNILKVKESYIQLQRIIEKPYIAPEYIK